MPNSDHKYTPARQTVIFLEIGLIISSMAIVPVAAQSAVTIDELQVCTTIDDRDARFDCYITLGEKLRAADQATDEQVALPALIATGARPSRSASVESKQVMPVKATANQQNPVTADSPEVVAAVPQAVSSAAAPQETAEASAAASRNLPDYVGGAKFEVARAGPLGGRITDCREGSDNKWRFLFENGQIWTQVNNRRMTFKDCDLTASITRDSFGYKMQIDGSKRKFRIARRK